MHADLLDPTCTNSRNSAFEVNLGKTQKLHFCYKNRLFFKEVMLESLKGKMVKILNRDIPKKLFGTWRKMVISANVKNRRRGHSKKIYEKKNFLIWDQGTNENKCCRYNMHMIISILSLDNLAEF